MLLNCGVGEDSCESLGQQGDQTSQFQRKSTLNTHWKAWCWSWISNPLATWCKDLTHLKRPWCWERLKAGEGYRKGWDGWMASSTQWTWVWVSSGRWWGRGRPSMLWSMGLQALGHNWTAEQQQCEGVCVCVSVCVTVCVCLHVYICICIYIWPYHMACGISVSQPGITSLSFVL